MYNYFGMKNELNSIFGSLNLPYTDSGVSGFWRSIQIKNNSTVLNTLPVSNSTSGSVVPNVVGMGLKDAVYLLENMGLKVAATGKGRVINQSLLAGTNFNKNQKIALLLN
jgi:cell division protein FtsI (penicillin-binding protein 3)